MTWIDLLILAVVAVSAISAFLNGLLVELFSLAGVLLGLLLAAADYPRLAPWVMHRGVNAEVANLVAFLLIALGVMLLAGLTGRCLRGAARWVGLGFLDRFLGAFFGLVKGCVLMTLFVMAVAAFLPDAGWLNHSSLAPFFLSAAHHGSRITPFEFGEKIRLGVHLLHMATNR